MTTNGSFDRDLLFYLESEAPTVAPAGLHDGAIGLARRARQRPRWLVGMRGGAFGTWGPRSDLAIGRAGYVLVVLALLVAAMLVAIAAGALRLDSSTPVPGRNGAIVLDLQDQRPGIDFVNPDGLGRHDDFGGSCPTFSPDGSVLSYWAGSPYELVIAAPDGSAPRGLGIFDDQAHPEDRFALSPDGTQFALFKRLRAYERADPDGSSTTVGGDDELWIIPVAGGPGSRILPVSGHPGEQRLLPVWSPDGRRIAYSTFTTGEFTSYRSAIDIIDVDGRNGLRLTSRTAGGLAGMSWSPDGRLVAYSGVRDPKLLASPGSGDWAPDGLDPALDLFVIGADGTGERNLTSSAAGESVPQWSPDGSRLAYLTRDAGRGERLYTVRMDGPVAVGSPARSPILSGYFGWSPDGTRLLAVVGTPSGRTERGRTTTSTLLLVDPEFRAEPTALVAVDALVLCAPSWQRLDP